jgi:hypothetical protein
MNSLNDEIHNFDRVVLSELFVNTFSQFSPAEFETIPGILQKISDACSPGGRLEYPELVKLLSPEELNIYERFFPLMEPQTVQLLNEITPEEEADILARSLAAAGHKR